MGVKDIAIVVIIVLILGAAILYMYRAKKSGKKCIGCPDACSCSKQQSGGCCCGCEDRTE